MKLSIIIPTLNAEGYLPGLFERISSQRLDDKEILVVDSESSDRTQEIAHEYGAKVQSIPQKEFNHGSTRNRAARSANGEYLVFLTQDVLPVNDSLLENMVSPLENDPEIAMSYGRQIAYERSRAIEKFIRGFNYPELSREKQKKDIEHLGVKTFFCSNACALYRKQIFFDLGGFREDTIMNEDMEFVYRIIMKGYKAYYAADAAVWHSHDYTFFEQFRRYVDIGVFFTNNPQLASYSKNESEGIKYILQASRYLINSRKYLELPHLFFDTVARFLGYRVGSHYRMFSSNMMKRLSMHKNYWDVK